MPKSNKLPPRIETLCLHALAKQGFSLRRATVALRKWEAGVLPEPCTEESKGKEIGLHTGCTCDGCRERLAMMFYNTASALAARDHHTT